MTTDGADGAADPGATGVGGRRSRAAILNGTIRLTLFSLAWPMAAQSLLDQCQGVFAVFWIGQLLGVSGLATLTVMGPVFTAIALISGIVPFGVQVLTARSTGRQDGEAIPIIVNGGYMACAFAVTIATVGIVWLGPIVRAFAGDLDVAHSLKTYLLPWLLFYCIPSINHVALCAISATGWTRFGLIQSMVSIGFMLLLTPLFIRGFHLGLAGLAISDGCADVLLLGLCASALYRFRHELALGAWRRTDWRVVFGIWRRILSAGISYQLAMAMTVVADVVLVRVIMRAGDAMVAGFGVAMLLIGLALGQINCVSVAAGIMIGQNAGAGKPDRAHACLRVAATWIGVYGIVVVMLASMSEPLVRIFTDDADVVARAIAAANVLKWLIPPALLSGLLLRAYTAVSPNKLGNTISVVCGLVSIAVVLTWPGTSLEKVAAAVISTQCLRLALLVLLYRRCFTSILDRGPSRAEP